MPVQWLGIALWLGFILFILLMLALDLGVFHRHDRVIRVREALGWSAFWICLALIFNVLLYFYWDDLHPFGSWGAQYTPREAALMFLAGYVVEKALSVDNLFVILMIFSYFRTPRVYQHRVLYYGILGALVFRFIFIMLGAVILHRFFWMTIVFGLFLIYSGVKMMLVKDHEIEPEKNPVIRLFKRLVPVTQDYRGKHFFTRIDARLFATPLFVSLLVVEVSDIIFAVDSIPAIFAITHDPFLVFTSNAFAILGLRSLYFALDGMVQLFRFLSYGLSLILIFIGGKMLYNYVEQEVVTDWGHFPIGVSLGIIGILLAGSVAASLLIPAPKPASLAPEPEKQRSLRTESE